MFDYTHETVFISLFKKVVLSIDISTRWKVDLL